jgi:hypothetical protein
MVVTNGAPHAVMVNLQPTAGVGTIAEADGTFGSVCICLSRLSNTFHTHIFVMTAIVVAPTQVIAILKPVIPSTAAKVIQED